MQALRFARFASVALVLAALPLGAQTAQPVQTDVVAAVTTTAVAATAQQATTVTISPPSQVPLGDSGATQVPVDLTLVAPPTQTTIAVGAARHITVSIVLGEISTLNSVVPVFGSLAPVNVEPGSTLKLSTPATSIASITWYKGTTALAATSATLEIASVTAADSGRYSAIVKDAAGNSWPYQVVTIRVETPRRQRLLNLSTRGTINASNPILIGGFVVDGSPGKLAETKTVLIRAVGPTLAKFGVSQPLADPKIQLFRADGTAVDLSSAATTPGSTNIVLAEAASGAYGLLLSGKDAVILVDLPAGAYGAHVSSISGGSGDVLVEVYEVPDTYLLPLL